VPFIDAKIHTGIIHLIILSRALIIEMLAMTIMPIASIAIIVIMTCRHTDRRDNVKR
jgi:hypothetical protein